MTGAAYSTRLGARLGRFFLNFWIGSWPTVAGCVLVAVIASRPLVPISRSLRALITLGIWFAVAGTNWLRLVHFLREHSEWSIPMSYAWYTSAWSGVWLALVAFASYGLRRLRWASTVQLACAIGIALFLPPLASAALMLMGCLLLGQCP